MLHVADLVGEDRLHLHGGHRVEQDIAQQHVPQPGQEADNGGVDHRAVGVPDEDVAHGQAGPLA